MPFFIKRGEKVNGPFTEAQIKSGVSDGKLKSTDMIGISKEGPWVSLAQSLTKDVNQSSLQKDNTVPRVKAAPETFESFEQNSGASDPFEGAQRGQQAEAGDVRYKKEPPPLLPVEAQPTSVATGMPQIKKRRAQSRSVLNGKTIPTLFTVVAVVCVIAVAVFIFREKDKADSITSANSPANSAAKETSESPKKAGSKAPAVGDVTERSPSDENKSALPKPRRAVDVIEGLTKALMTSEESVLMSYLDELQIPDEEFEGMKDYFLANRNRLHSSMRDLPEEELVAKLQENFRRYPQSRNRELPRVLGMPKFNSPWRILAHGPSVRNSCWTESVISVVPWEKIEYLVSVEAQKGEEQPDGTVVFCAFSFFTDGTNYFYLYIDEVLTGPVLPNRPVFGSTVQFGCLNTKSYITALWDREWPARLRELRNPKLQPLIAILESKPDLRDISDERRETLVKQEREIALSEDQVNTAIDLAVQRKLDLIYVENFPLNSSMLQRLAKLSSLVEVRLINTQLQDSDILPLLSCENLAWVALSGNQITLEGAAQFAKLSSLKRLILYDTPASNSPGAMEFLKTKIPDAIIVF